VLEFVSRYVELKPMGSGAIGLCPLHNFHGGFEVLYWTASGA
jgi:hypothetical protein